MARARETLVGAVLLSEKPDAPVLFVSSIEARAAAESVLRPYTAVCAESEPKHADMRPLAGRLVDVWAPGGPDGAAWAAKVCALILPIAERVRVIDNTEFPDQRDWPELIAQGWTCDQALQWITDHARAVAAAPKVKELGKKHPGREPLPALNAPAESGSSLALWQGLGLICDGRGNPFPELANVSLVLQRHPDIKGKIYYDSFRDKIYTTMHGKPREWRDADDRDLNVWLQQAVRLDKVQYKIVQQAVMHCAYKDQRNSFQDWVKSIEWDGIERLNDWLVDCVGCSGTDHHRAVGRNWLISMIARGFKPGEKADHMPVLEHDSGRGKSATLEILGGCADPDGHDWYAAVTTDFGSKTFHENIQGRILVEIPDMAGFTKTEHGKILAELTTRVDPYRVPWDKYSSDHPRRCIFAGTSESSDYLNYPEGKRRYWPVRCGNIDTELLRKMRAQLFAEAYQAWLKGATWHEMPASTRVEQSYRINEDAWQRKIIDYLNGKLAHQTVIPEAVHSTELLEMIGIPLKDQHDGHKRRIKKIMDMLGWEQHIVRNLDRTLTSGSTAKVWRQKMVSEDPAQSLKDTSGN